MDNKQAKAQLKQDINAFYANYVEKIAHTDVNTDQFKDLGVFGNFYALAIENYPDMAQKYNDFKEVIKNTAEEKNKAHKAACKDCEEILEKCGIQCNGQYVYIGDYTYSVPRRFWNTDFVETAQNAVRFLLTEKDRYALEDSVKRYVSLKKELESGEVSFLRKGTVIKEIKDLENNDLYVPSYNKLNAYIDTIKSADSQLKSSTALREYKKALEQEDKLKNPNWGTLEEFKNNLTEKAGNILGMAYAKIYSDNFDVLRMAPNGAKQKLLELTTQNAEYYSKHSIENVAKNLDKYVTASSVASELHEKWRDARKQEDGVYPPRWKVVKDDVFINQVKQMEELPKNIRIVDGVVEQDIANTEFKDLCLDYKIENFEAALVACELIKSKYPKEKAGVVGKIVHDKWLERNPWAKGSDLDVEFEDLITSEQIKDLIQYEIAKKRTANKERNSII